MRGLVSELFIHNVLMYWQFYAKKMKIEMQGKKIVATQTQKYQTQEYLEVGNVLTVKGEAIVKPKVSTSNRFF